MLAALLLLLGGVSLHPVPLKAPVLDARVADVDADGHEDVVAVTAKDVLLFRGGENGVSREPAVVRPAPPLTVVGEGLFGVVRDGRYRDVADPFGAWREGEAGPASLLGALGRGDPAILVSPGDLDGDGRDDPLLAGPEGFVLGPNRVRVRPPASLEIQDNEAFAVRYEIPVPVVGNWTGSGRQVVFLRGQDVVVYDGGKEVDRIPLPLHEEGQAASTIQSTNVLARDVDGDGRLDLLVVQARGKTGVFGVFEATALLFSGGHIYDRKKKGFHRPRSVLKVSGVLLRPQLVDVDGDGDLDLVLSTVDTSLLQAAVGTAPGVYRVFRYDEEGYAREPAWTYKAPVALSAFRETPRPPVVFLPDLDGGHVCEAVSLGPPVALLRAAGAKGFSTAATCDLDGPEQVRYGRHFAVVYGKGGLVFVEADG